MPSKDDASWAMRGGAMVCLVPRRRRLSPLPSGLRKLPGRAIVVAERFDDSPVGPFVSLSIGEPARLGARVGFYFGLCVVNHAEVRKLMRRYWGYPAEVGALVWSSEGPTSHRLEWEERGLVVAADAGRLRLPAFLPGKALQRRADGPVVVPGSTRSLVRRAEVSIEMPTDDPLHSLAGIRSGVVLDGLARRRHPARHPFGLFSTLRAPLGAPEPGVLGITGQPSEQRPIQCRTSRAYSSVG